MSGFHSRSLSILVADIILPINWSDMPLYCPVTENLEQYMASFECDVYFLH